MDASATPVAPVRTNGPISQEHRALYFNVRKALLRVSSDFATDFVVPKVKVPDLYSLNTALGALIEQEVVAALNRLRTIWDPKKKYASYNFERQPQSFPDVLLKETDTGNILMGIELKGWFALAKEGEPSFRYKVTPGVCRPQDLLVVYPWALEQVIAGKPILLPPFIDEARYCAESRNYYWQVDRLGEKKNPAITPARCQVPGASVRDPISDVPEADDGGNFGRLARCGVMKPYVQKSMEVDLCGIELGAWQKFFKMCAGTKVPARLEESLRRVAETYQVGAGEDAVKYLKAELSRLIDEIFG